MPDHLEQFEAAERGKMQGVSGLNGGGCHPSFTDPVALPVQELWPFPTYRIWSEPRPRDLGWSGALAGPPNFSVSPTQGRFFDLEQRPYPGLAASRALSIAAHKLRHDGCEPAGLAAVASLKGILERQHGAIYVLLPKRGDMRTAVADLASKLGG